jgi:hypothetical protein
VHLEWPHIPLDAHLVRRLRCIVAPPLGCRVLTGGYSWGHGEKRSCSYEAARPGGVAHRDTAARGGVCLAQVNAWLSRTVKEQKDRQNARILELWLACWTEEEIAKVLQLPRTTIETRLVELTEEYKRTHSSKLTFQDDFEYYRKSTHVPIR